MNTAVPAGMTGRSCPVADFLLELFSEEIPARMQAKACDDLARLFNEQMAAAGRRSEEHTAELQSPMRNSYAVFCFKKKKTPQIQLTLQTAITTETRVKHASLTLA